MGKKTTSEIVSSRHLFEILNSKTFFLWRILSKWGKTSWKTWSLANRKIFSCPQYNHFRVDEIFALKKDNKNASLFKNVMVKQFSRWLSRLFIQSIVKKEESFVYLLKCGKVWIGLILNLVLECCTLSLEKISFKVNHVAFWMMFIWKII